MGSSDVVSSQVVAHVDFWVATHHYPHLKRVQVPGMLHVNVHVNLRCAQRNQNSNETSLTQPGF